VNPSKLISILLLVGLLPGVPSSNAQVVRTRELNTQYHRARTAWLSGSSILEAKARIDRVIDALPDDAEARILRAEILLGMNRPDSALVDARAAARLAPSSGRAHLVHCEAASRAGMREEAARAMRSSADQIMSDVTSYVRLSQCAQDLGLLREAESYARLAMAQGALNPAGHLQLARVFAAAGERDMAVTTLVKGLESGVLRASVIRQDHALAPLADDPRVRAALR
jgi:predicted Zn-dependent protease